jgi:hypothetical protein
MSNIAKKIMEDAKASKKEQKLVGKTYNVQDVIRSLNKTHGAFKVGDEIIFPEGAKIGIKTLGKIDFLKKQAYRVYKTVNKKEIFI